MNITRHYWIIISKLTRVIRSRNRLLHVQDGRSILEFRLRNTCLLATRMADRIVKHVNAKEHRCWSNKGRTVSFRGYTTFVTPLARARSFHDAEKVSHDLSPDSLPSLFSPTYGARIAIRHKILILSHHKVITRR